MTKKSIHLALTMALTCAIALSACTNAGQPAGTPALPAATQPALQPSIQPTATRPAATDTPIATNPLPTETPAETLPPTATATNPPTSTPLPSLTPWPATNTAVPEPTQAEQTPASSGEARAAGKAIIVDHTSIDLFEKIPDEYLEKARSLKVLFVDQSVGQNISQGLDCLTAQSWGQSRDYCRRDYVDADWNWKSFSAAEFDQAPERIRFAPDPVKYDRSGWTFAEFRGTWFKYIEEFVTNDIPKYQDDYDVFSIKITYLMVADNSDIMDAQKGFFAGNSNRFGWNEMLAVRDQYPEETIFYWTSSLARNIGSQNALEFNERMRKEAREKGLFLLDIADIEAHTDKGTPCFDNRDGVEYCAANGKCENYPDDGQNLPAICQDYTTETDGGHLGSVSGGSIRLAKAFWVLMAQIAGWQP